MKIPGSVTAQLTAPLFVLSAHLNVDVGGTLFPYGSSSISLLIIYGAIDIQHCDKPGALRSV